jgi:hypothetical protein
MSNENNILKPNERMTISNHIEQQQGHPLSLLVYMDYILSRGSEQN